MNSNKVLILGLNWPEPEATAAGTRMMQLIHWFLEKNFQITFASTATFSNYSIDLTTLGIDQQHIKLNHNSFDEFALKLDPSIVVFDRFITEEQFGWRLAEKLPKAIRILDTEDLHSLRACREIALSDKKIFNSTDWLSADITKRELASILRSDLSLIISDFEFKLLVEKVKIDSSLLFYLPFVYRELTKSIVENWPPFDQREHFVFIGNGKHAPNTDAILWLNKSIWPLLRKSLPNAELHIYGPYMPERIQKMDNAETGFRIKGWVKDIAPVLTNARLNLVPLRFGAGLKGKLLEGFRNGIPAITTAVGAEGTGDINALKLCTRDEEVSFSNLAIQLYLDSRKWKEVQALGTNLINKHFSNEDLKEELLEKIIDLGENLQLHRAANILGGILTHSSMRSTKYLSKWIEAKNKL